MPTGTIVAKLTTSDASLPLAEAAVSFWEYADGEPTLLALRLTDRSGVTSPVTLETPSSETSTYCCSEVPSYRTVNIFAEQTGYDRVSVLGAQIFDGTRSVQELSLVPTPVFPKNTDRTRRIVIPAPMVEDV